MDPPQAQDDPVPADLTGTNDEVMNEASSSGNQIGNLPRTSGRRLNALQLMLQSPSRHDVNKEKASGGDGGSNDEDLGEEGVKGARQRDNNEGGEGESHQQQGATEKTTPVNDDDSDGKMENQVPQQECGDETIPFDEQLDILKENEVRVDSGKLSLGVNDSRDQYHVAAGDNNVEQDEHDGGDSLEIGGKENLNNGNESAEDTSGIASELENELMVSNVKNLDLPVPMEEEMVKNEPDVQTQEMKKPALRHQEDAGILDGDIDTRLPSDNLVTDSIQQLVKVSEQEVTFAGAIDNESDRSKNEEKTLQQTTKGVVAKKPDPEHAFSFADKIPDLNRTTQDDTQDGLELNNLKQKDNKILPPIKSTPADPPSLFMEGGTKATVVRQRKTQQLSSYRQYSDPPDSMDPYDLEHGNDSPEYAPLIASPNPSSSTAKLAYHPANHKSWRSKSQNMQSSLPSLKYKLSCNQCQCAIKNCNPTILRVTLLTIFFTLCYLIVDRLDLKSIKLSKKHLSYSQLSSRLSKANTLLHKKLDYEYGEYAKLLWQSGGITSNSLERLKRRMMMKILQTGVVLSDVHHDDGGDNVQERAGAVVNFTWVTAGDGGAAGYGNLFHQAYTQIIEDTVKDSFDAVGIRFIANNYAMDGMSSGPELALCMESIYGFDIDVLSWDFYETDKDQMELYQLWANRAGIHPSMPVLFLQNAESERIKINSQLESVGLATVGFNAAKIRTMLPNSNSTDNNDLPYALSNYKCDGMVEQGKECEPYKWDMESTSCNLTPFQTEARKGWKDHRLIGRVIGVFLIQLLQSALDELNVMSFTMETLGNLSLAEHQERGQYFSSSLHKVHDGNHVSKNTEFLGGLARFSPFWKTNAFCRTALLPNQARYDGISTEGSKGQRHAGGFHTGYEIGHSISDLPKPQPHKSNQLMLVYTPESNHNCSDTFHIDYKDFFGVRWDDGRVATMIPNELETSKFTDRHKTSARVVIVCDSMCDSSECSNRVSVADLATNDVSITLNGDKVHQVLNLKLYGGDSNCYMLHGKHTFLWPNRGRQFEMGINVNTEGMLHVSSIIII